MAKDKEITTMQAHGMPIQTKVDLIRAKIDILKLKANDHDWCCYVPDDVKKSLNKTLADINKELEAIDTPEPIEYEWNLYHDMDNRSYNDVARIKELEDSVKSLLATVAQFADQLPSPKT